TAVARYLGPGPRPKMARAARPTATTAATMSHRLRRARAWSLTSMVRGLLAMAAELSLGEGHSILPYLRRGSRPRVGATVRRHERFDGERTLAVVAQERSVAEGDTIRTRTLMSDIPPPDHVLEQQQEVTPE